MIYFEDNLVKIYNKDCRDMSELEDNSVQCVVTSPPYWGLRKYAGLPDMVWGDKDCEHEWVGQIRKGEGRAGGHLPHLGDSFDLRSSGLLVKTEIETNTCSLCGAWKGQYGLEPTPEMYIEHTVEILREIRRVLRKDGVVFWNIGDSYFGSWADYSGKGRTAISSWNRKAYGDNNPERPPSSYPNPILKPKDLCLIPFRVAIAAQEDGWWVRSVIIWSKPNPMPESVTDRPTESHEYILMLTKSARYYWDADAVREEYQGDVNHGPRDKASEKYEGTNLFSEGGRDYYSKGGRNIRTVWEFPTQPYPEAHFAVFPEKLPELCIKAASKPDDLVLDPFLGAGTTLWVAKKLGRKGVGYELSEEYCQLALERNRQQVLLGGE